MCTLTAFACVPLLSPAAQRCETPIAHTLSVQGQLEVRLAGEQGWRSVKPDQTFCPNDALRTGADSRAAILLLPETVLRLDQLSSLVFTRAETATTPSWLELLKGAAHFISRDPRALKIITPLANAAIEGTEFLMRVDEQQSDLIVYEGRVRFASAAGDISVGSGEQAIARPGVAPVLQAVVRPRDAVQWTLYYPPVLFSQTGKVGEAARALAVGRVAKARAALEEALRQNPADGDALALQAIIALTQNDQSAAADLAKRAVEAAPQTATAWIARSYVQQAQFDLSGALASLQTATGVAPENALAWARLAELQLAVGELDKGLDAAERARSLDPDIALTDTVLGFAYLTQIRIPEAKAAFEEAGKLDQAAPLPRLGLGLALIRKGDLEAGRRQIETAVALDPGNSLLRSYMGKAYYDEKRDKLAGSQYRMAKELDPNDPTPWFYDAIRLETENRPIEALHDLQTSIKLNDNRAVYRSRLELDADLATRSAGVARIYSDLGFEQRALVEGWNSVNTDPGNYSAHRLLADTYSALPRHQVARVSELLQSQLLQPLNMTPVQPQLAETNLFILEGLGPADPGLLEFNPLFTRNRLALQADGIAGNNSTWGDELIQNGIYNNWSWSAGQFHYESDGYRDNNDQDQNIYNLFVQGALSWRTSVQAEYRHNKIKNGDLIQRFDPDDFQNTLREKTKTETARLGLHHVFTPRSEILASVIYLHDRDYDTTQSLPLVLPPIPGLPPLTASSDLDADQNEDSHTAEIQHLYHGNAFRLVSGAGDYSGDNKVESRTDTTFQPPLLPASSTISSRDQDQNHKNAYVYAYLPYSEALNITLGLSYDDLKVDQHTKSTSGGLPLPGMDNRITRQKLNPKLGITWEVHPGTTLRAAGFRTVARSLTSKQTLEPTQVAGFNQFYDEQIGTKAIRYGLAADQVFTENLSCGVEYSWRDTDVILIDNGRKLDWDERFGRAYLYWTPTQRLAASAEYLYERFKRDPAFTGEFRASKLSTHRVPLTVNYFHPDGFIGRLRTTYIDQDGDFSTAGPGFVGGASTMHENDNFWLVDASIGYRLPKRYGIVTLGVANLFDKEFHFVDTDPYNPRIQPDRFVFGNLTLSF